MISGNSQRAIADGIAAMRERACQPARNDPEAFQRVTDEGAAIDRLVTASRDEPLDPSLIEARLLSAASMLPLAAGCSPGQAMRLAGRMLGLHQSSRTSAEKAAVMRALTYEAVSKGGLDYVYRDQPGVQALYRVTGEREQVFPHGLTPEPPVWPAALSAVASGADRAVAAFEDLHVRGWLYAFEHYHFMALETMAEVLPWYEAARAFARVAAGSHATADVDRCYRRTVLRLDGPGAALELLPPPSAWAGEDGRQSFLADIDWVEDILVQLVKERDWVRANDLVARIFSREDLLTPDVRTRIIKRQLRIEKALGIGSRPGRGRTSGSDDVRPGRLGPALAAPRPASAQAIVDAAEAGDAAAAAFLSDMSTNALQTRLA
jgi:hypothetical protein